MVGNNSKTRILETWCGLIDNALYTTSICLSSNYSLQNTHSTTTPFRRANGKNRYKTH